MPDDAVFVGVLVGPVLVEAAFDDVAEGTAEDVVDFSRI